MIKPQLATTHKDVHNVFLFTYLVESLSNDFSETLSESVSAQTLKVGYLDKSYVLNEDHDNSLDHCYDPSI